MPRRTKDSSPGYGTGIRNSASRVFTTLGSSDNEEQRRRAEASDLGSDEEWQPTMGSDSDVNVDDDEEEELQEPTLMKGDMEGSRGNVADGEHDDNLSHTHSDGAGQIQDPLRPAVSLVGKGNFGRGKSSVEDTVGQRSDVLNVVKPGQSSTKGAGAAAPFAPQGTKPSNASAVNSLQSSSGDPPKRRRRGDYSTLNSSGAHAAASRETNLKTQRQSSSTGNIFPQRSASHGQDVQIDASSNMERSSQKKSSEVLLALGHRRSQERKERRRAQHARKASAGAPERSRGSQSPLEYGSTDLHEVSDQQWADRQGTGSRMPRSSSARSLVDQSQGSQGTPGSSPRGGDSVIVSSRRPPSLNRGEHRYSSSRQGGSMGRINSAESLRFGSPVLGIESPGISEQILNPKPRRSPAGRLGTSKSSSSIGNVIPIEDRINRGDKSTGSFEMKGMRPSELRRHASSESFISAEPTIDQLGKRESATPKSRQYGSSGHSGRRLRASHSQHSEDFFMPPFRNRDEVRRRNTGGSNMAREAIARRTASASKSFGSDKANSSSHDARFSVSRSSRSFLSPPIPGRGYSYLECVIECLKGCRASKRRNFLRTGNTWIWLSTDLRHLCWVSPRKETGSESILLTRVRRLKHADRELTIETGEDKVLELVFQAKERGIVWLCGLSCLIPARAHVKSKFKHLQKREAYNPLHDTWKGRPLSERKHLDDFIILGTLGQGSYGKVKLAICTTDRQFYAVKVLSKFLISRQNRNAIFEKRQRGGGKSRSLDRNNQFKCILMKEINIMKKLDHRNVVKLKRVLEDKEAGLAYIIVEFMTRGPIMNSSNLQGAARISEARAKEVFVDVLQGLEYLHKSRVAHRDIKPENLLHNADGTVKISDFGAAKMYGPDGKEIRDNTLIQMNREGTPAFTAPELCISEESPKPPPQVYSADIWSLGATLFYMLYGRVPFFAESIFEMYHEICTKTLKFPDNPRISKRCKDLMRSMMEKEPSRRITISKISKSAWLEDIDMSKRGREA